MWSSKVASQLLNMAMIWCPEIAASFVSFNCFKKTFDFGVVHHWGSYDENNIWLWQKLFDVSHSRDNCLLQSKYAFLLTKLLCNDLWCDSCE